MNFLAHLSLSGDDPEVMLGNLMGDFLKGVDAARYPPAVQRGIRLHRTIDSFTDAHPVFSRSRRRFPPPYRRYGGVLVDVFYDHFLARDWRRYRPREDLSCFVRRAYQMLASPPVEPPPRLKNALPRMIRDDWLGSCATQDGIDRQLKRISRRVSRANPLGSGVSQLALHYDGLAADFAEFFPALMRRVAHGTEVETPQVPEERAS